MDFALKAILIMRRYHMNDVADHLQAMHKIDRETLSSRMNQWDRTSQLPAEPDAPAHADRGTVVQFDDEYGF